MCCVSDILRPQPNGTHLADHISKYVFLKVNLIFDCCIDENVTDVCSWGPSL